MRSLKLAIQNLVPSGPIGLNLVLALLNVGAENNSGTENVNMDEQEKNALEKSEKISPVMISLVQPGRYGPILILAQNLAESVFNQEQEDVLVV